MIRIQLQRIRCGIGSISFCNVYFRPELRSFFTKILLWWWKSRSDAAPDRSTTPTGLYGRHQALRPPLFLPWCSHLSGTGWIGTHRTTWPSFFAPKSNLYTPEQIEAFFFRLASPLSGFLRATQMFSPNPLSSLRFVWEEMLFLSLLNKDVSSTVFVFTVWVHQTFKWSFFLYPVRPVFNNALDSSEPNLCSFSNILRCFLCLMHANNLTFWNR